MASTLKLENVAPPISGSVVSAPSSANTVAVPRCPFTANCCVKFAAPLVSVIVPAASKSSLLKSREFSGRLDTSDRERCSPPLPCGAEAACPCPRTRVASATDNCRFVVSASPSLTTRDCAAWYKPCCVITATLYVAGVTAENANSPLAFVLAVKVNLPEASERMTVTPAIGAPELSHSMPDQEASGGAAKITLQEDRK